MIDIVSSRVVRALGSEGAYSDALSSVSKFNARLLRERRIRLRLPFVDSQTHIIQTPTQNHLWKNSSQRLMPTRHDQVAIYARKQWYKKRPHVSKPSSTQSQLITTTNESSTSLSSQKSDASNEPVPISADDDARLVIQAGELGKLFIVHARR
jgi:hypothetical protein